MKPGNLPTLLWVLVLLSFAPVGVHAQSEDLERAVNAYNSGDYATAVSLWQFHAHQGNREAQYAMGVAYHEGNGVSHDLEKALSWFRQAAESNHPIAMFNLGVARWEGRGVKQSFARAVDWWEQAAGQNHALSQYNLGLAHYLGKGAERDIDKARHWLVRAVDQGHQDARRVLSIIGGESSDNATTAGAEPTTSAVSASDSTATNESISPDQVIEAAFSAANVADKPLTVRNEPRASAAAINTIAAGTPVQIIGRLGAWAQVKIPGGSPVWVFGSYVDGAPTGRITGDRVRARTQPSTGSDSTIAGNFNKGAAVIVHDESGDWKKVSAPEVIKNWVPSSGLTVHRAVTRGWMATWDAAVNPDRKATGASTTTEVEAQFNIAWVKQANTRVFGRPDGKAPIIGQLDANTPVKVIGRKGDWALTKTPGGLDVWVYGKFVTEHYDAATINDDRVHIRSLPSTAKNSDVLGLLDKGAGVQVISRKGDWIRLRVPHSVAGWIELNQLTAPENPNANWQADWDAARAQAKQ
jgi:SH3-like domain-containing protein